MIDFDFNSVKKPLNSKENFSKISIFDNISKKLEKFFEIFFIGGHISKFNFEKENNRIKISPTYNYILYINDDFQKYQDIIKDVFPYLKYVILDDSCKINLSLTNLRLTRFLYDILKELNYINYIKINSFINTFNYNDYNNSIDFLNLITSKNKKLFVGELTMPIIDKNRNEIEKFPIINSKYVIIKNNSNIIDYFGSVGLKEYHFYDFYSDVIHIEFPDHIFERGLAHTIYFRNGLKSLDQSIKNDNCKIILSLQLQEDIIFLKDMISKLDLNHNWIIK